MPRPRHRRRCSGRSVDRDATAASPGRRQSLPHRPRHRELGQNCTSRGSWKFSPTSRATVQPTGAYDESPLHAPAGWDSSTGARICPLVRLEPDKVESESHPFGTRPQRKDPVAPRTPTSPHLARSLRCRQRRITQHPRLPRDYPRHAHRLPSLQWACEQALWRLSEPLCPFARPH